MSDSPRNTDQTSVENQALKTKKRDRNASEEKLIEAGIEIFSKFGFNGATTKMIAKYADVNESLIGRYFDGKEGLLLTIVERFKEDVMAEVLSYPPQGNLEEELVCYVTSKLKKSREHACLGKIILSQALTNNTFRKKSLERIPIFTDLAFQERIIQLQTNGKVSPAVDPAQIYANIQLYLQSQWLFGMILFERPNSEILEHSIEFCKIYARGILK